MKRQIIFRAVGAIILVLILLNIATIYHGIVAVLTPLFQWFMHTAATNITNSMKK